MPLPGADSIGYLSRSGRPRPAGGHEHTPPGAFSVAGQGIGAGSSWHSRCTSYVSMTRGVFSDAVHALRMGVHHPGFSIVVVLTLALGIGAVTAMFSVLNQTLIRPLPFPSPDDLVIGRTTSDGSDGLRERSSRHLFHASY